MSNALRGHKIIDALRAAVHGDIKRVTIEGKTWVRLDEGDQVVKVTRTKHQPLPITDPPEE